MKQDEVYEGDKHARKNLFIILALYFLLLLWLEPLIDYFLANTIVGINPASMEALNKTKIFIANIAFGTLRSLPMCVFLWFGYRTTVSARMPPPGMKFPFTVRVIKDKQARMFGMLLMVVAGLLLSRELVLLTKNAFI